MTIFASAIHEHAAPEPSLFLAPAKVVGQPRDELLRLNSKGIANPQQRENRGWPSSLDHLPVTHAEPVGNHVLLAQFAFRPMRADAMAQGAEESPVACRKFPGRTHHSKLKSSRAKSPRAKLRTVPRACGFHMWYAFLQIF
jgi:hypothetical protein